MGRPNSTLMRRAMSWALAKSASRRSRESDGEVVQVGGDIALGDGAVGDASDGGVIELLADPSGSGAVSSDDERALGGGVDLSVFSAQRGEQKRSAVEGFGVADGGDDDVHLGSGAGEGGQRGGDEDGGDIFDGDGGGGDLEAHALHEIGEHLGGEDGLLLISGAAQADDEAVAEEGIVTDTLDGGDLADAHLARGRGVEGGGGGGGEQDCGRE